MVTLSPLAIGLLACGVGGMVLLLWALAGKSKKQPKQDPLDELLKEAQSLRVNSLIKITDLEQKLRLLEFEPNQKESIEMHIKALGDVLNYNIQRLINKINNGTPEG